MTREDLIEAFEAAAQRLRDGNLIEPPGTPTDLIERGAILALETLRDELVKS